MASHQGVAPATARYGGSRLVFRGPERDTGQRFLVVLGGAAAYGRDVAAPWPDLLEHRLGRPVVNLALPQAGLDAWVDDPDVMALVGRAEAVILHLTGAALLSNRFYSVHPRRNDRFVGASGALRHLYPDVDFTEFAFVGHMLKALASRGETRLRPLVAELQAAWSDRMARLIGHAGGRALLIWAEPAPPPARAPLPGGVDFVDAAMVAAAAGRAAGLLHLPLPADERSAPGLGPGTAALPTAALPTAAGHARIAAGIAARLDRLVA
jgi:hypothetical protein